MSPAGRDALRAMLTRLKNDLSGLDLGKPDEAKAALQAKYPLTGDYLVEVRRLCERGVEEGWLCSTERGGVRFSRLSAPDKYFPFSVDAVILGGSGPEHRHPKGEINVGWPTAGEPAFCGVEPGWSIFAPGSRHVPSVSGGTMFLLYFLPDGAIEWMPEKRSSAGKKGSGTRRKAAAGAAAGKEPAAKKATTRKPPAKKAASPKRSASATAAPRRAAR